MAKCYKCKGMLVKDGPFMACHLCQFFVSAKLLRKKDDKKKEKKDE